MIMNLKWLVAIGFDWEFQLGQTGVFYIDEIALVGPGF